MAAPHVAGMMAILLSENEYTPPELIEKVKEAATLTVSSRAAHNDIAYEISQLTGISYNNSAEIKVLYMDPSFLKSSNSFSSFSIRNSYYLFMHSYKMIIITSIFILLL